MMDRKAPWVTRWGRDGDSWNIVDPTDEDAGDSDGSGFPGRAMVMQAVGRWALTQPVEPTADMVAAMFNLPADLAQDVMTDNMACSLASAVQIWSSLNDREGHAVTVGAAALAFHLSPGAIVEAADQHYYLYLSGDRSDPASLVIEHEGE